MRELMTEDLGRGAPPPSHPAGRTRFGAWRIEALIADGGCGSVYRARHVVLDRPAAVKVLHPALADDPAMVARFIQEAQAVNRIRHPHIVDVIDVGQVAGQPYLVMELLDERNLEQRLTADGRLTLAECLAIFTPLCQALAAAHAAGFVHRDVKARNIGFTADATAALRLLDFGIAKLLAPEDDRGATATMRVGTPHCVAPEQIRGLGVDARTDVYALGVLLFHLATGVYPFDADDSTEVERMHLDAPPPRPSALVPGLAVVDALVAAAMAKARDARPPSATAFLAALTTATAPPPAARRAFHRRAPIRRVPAAARWSVR